MFVSFHHKDGTAFLVSADRVVFSHDPEKGAYFADIGGGAMPVDHDAGVLFGSLTECLEVHNTHMVDTDHEPCMRIINTGRHAPEHLRKHVPKSKPTTQS